MPTDKSSQKQSLYTRSLSQPTPSTSDSFDYKTEYRSAYEPSYSQSNLLLPPAFNPRHLPPQLQNQSEAYQPHNMMTMSHRDLGYGYMPQALPGYSAAQSYHSTIAPMPDFYIDPSRNFDLSYLPNYDYPKYSNIEEQRNQKQKRRRRNSTERRHQVKLLARKAGAQQSMNASQTTTSRSRLPSVSGTGFDESSIQASPIDLFTTQAPMNTNNYITDSYQRSASYEPSTTIRDDYRHTTPLHTTYDMIQAISSPPSYNTAYTMASLNPTMSTLAPPSLIHSPNPQHAYSPSSHTSPLLSALQPGSISPATESIMLDNRRDKPQCWDHGCNGREFSTFSNLLRHQREKSGSASKSYCPRCGAEFTRTTARNGHMEHGKCKGRRASTVGQGQSQRGSASSGSGTTGISTSAL